MKRKDNISQKIYGNKIFSVFGKRNILFPTNMKLLFCQKRKEDLFPKNTPKDDISGITEKDDIHPRKADIGILCTFMETFLRVFIYCFPIKKARKLNL